MSALPQKPLDRAPMCQAEAFQNPDRFSEQMPDFLGRPVTTPGSTDTVRLRPSVWIIFPFHCLRKAEVMLSRPGYERGRITRFRPDVVMSRKGSDTRVWSRWMALMTFRGPCRFSPSVVVGKSLEKWGRLGWQVNLSSYSPTWEGTVGALMRVLWKHFHHCIFKNRFYILEKI